MCKHTHTHTYRHTQTQICDLIRVQADLCGKKKAVIVKAPHADDKIAHGSIERNPRDRRYKERERDTRYVSSRACSTHQKSRSRSSSIVMRIARSGIATSTREIARVWVRNARASKASARDLACMRVRAHVHTHTHAAHRHDKARAEIGSRWIRQPRQGRPLNGELRR